MDKNAYIDWLQAIDTDELIALANRWGLDLAKKLTASNPKDLQIFDEYLVDHYSEMVIPYLESYQYDQMRGV